MNILRFDYLEQNNDQTTNEKLIEEYETNLNRASQETERIRNELAKFEEEKVLHEKRTNLLIQSLKEECENMKSQGSIIVFFSPKNFHSNFLSFGLEQKDSNQMIEKLKNQCEEYQREIEELIERGFAIQIVHSFSV